MTVLGEDDAGTRQRNVIRSGHASVAGSVISCKPYAVRIDACYRTIVDTELSVLPCVGIDKLAITEWAYLRSIMLRYDTHANVLSMLFLYFAAPLRTSGAL